MRHGNIVIGIAISLALHGTLLALVAQLPAPSSSQTSNGSMLVPLRLLAPGPKSRDARPAQVAEHRAETTATVVPVPPTRRAPPAPSTVPTAMRPSTPRKVMIQDHPVSLVEQPAPGAGMAGVAADGQARPGGGPAGEGGEARAASGHGAQAGQDGHGSGPIANAAATQAADTLSDLRRAYALDVRHSLETVGRYRTVARRLGLVGRVVLRVRIDDAGRVSESRIDAPSRYRELDAAALDSTRRLQALAPPPGGSIDVVVPVVFTMRAR